MVRIKWQIRFDNTTPRYRLQELNSEKIYHASLRTNTQGEAIQFHDSVVEEHLVSRRMFSGNTPPNIISLFNYTENIQNCCLIKKSTILRDVSFNFYFRNVMLFLVIVCRFIFTYFYENFRFTNVD